MASHTHSAVSSRRHVLAAGVMASLAGCVPTASLAASDAALLAAEREHQRLSFVVNKIARTDAELDAAADALSAVEGRMHSTPAATIEGMRAKARVLLSLMRDEDSDGDIEQMARSLAQDLL